jgi:hypothetical protein
VVNKVVDIDPAKLQELLKAKGISGTEVAKVIKAAQTPPTTRRGVRGHGAAQPKKGELGSL